MSTSTIVLESYQPGDLRQCQPNLMPFHISYNGPALISTFMDVKPAKEDSAKEPSTGATTTNAGSDMNSGDAQDAATGGPAKADAEVAEDAMRVDEPTTTNIQKEVGPDSSMSNQPQIPTAQQAARFTSSFRGRVIQGLDVDIPQGYRGVVLRGPASDAPPTTTTTASAPKKVAASSSKSKAKSKASAVTQTAVDEEDDAPGPSTRRRGRLTRSAVSKKKIVVKEEEVEEEVKETAAVAEVAIDVDAEGTAQTAATTTTAAGDAELTAQRRLKPVGEFSKFTLWHPDNPVVENQDEYYRSLNEWTVLAAALHQGDDEDP